VAEVKSSESDVGFDHDSDLENGRQIIDTEPSATIATTDIYPDEPDDQRKMSASFIHKCG
jgi:hypothetical protein